MRWRGLVWGIALCAALGSAGCLEVPERTVDYDPNAGNTNSGTTSTNNTTTATNNATTSTNNSTTSTNNATTSTNNGTTSTNNSTSTSTNNSTTSTNNATTSTNNATTSTNNNTTVVDSDSDGVPDGTDEPLCRTGGWELNGDCRDNCVNAPNTDQLDTNEDGEGDACDDDDDGDSVLDEADNCPLIANADQLNSDGSDDGGDACDDDDDDDTVLDGADNCPLIANVNQTDDDDDGIGDACDDNVAVGPAFARLGNDPPTTRFVTHGGVARLAGGQPALVVGTAMQMGPTTPRVLTSYAINDDGSLGQLTEATTDVGLVTNMALFAPDANQGTHVYTVRPDAIDTVFAASGLSNFPAVSLVDCPGGDLTATDVVSEVKAVRLSPGQGPPADLVAHHVAPNELRIYLHEPDGTCLFRDIVTLDLETDYPGLSVDAITAMNWDNDPELELVLGDAEMGLIFIDIEDLDGEPVFRHFMVGGAFDGVVDLQLTTGQLDDVPGEDLLVTCAHTLGTPTPQHRVLSNPTNPGMDDGAIDSAWRAVVPVSGAFAGVSARPTNAALLVDVDRDGDLDAILANSYADPMECGPATDCMGQLLINDGSGRFTQDPDFSQDPASLPYLAFVMEFVEPPMPDAESVRFVVAGPGPPPPMNGMTPPNSEYQGAWVIEMTFVPE